MPGTWLPATASAVSASTPKMLLIHTEANPWSAARCNCSRSAVIGAGPVGSCSPTPILMECLPAPGPWTVPFCLADARFARLPANRPFRRPARVRHRHLGGQCRVVGDQQPVDLDTAAPAQFMDKGQYGGRDGLSGHSLAVYLADRLGDDHHRRGGQPG